MGVVSITYQAVRREYPRWWPVRLCGALALLAWWRGVIAPVCREIDNGWRWLGRGRTGWAHWAPRPGDHADGCNGRGAVRAVSIRRDRVTFVDGSTDSLRNCVRPALREAGQ